MVGRRGLVVFLAGAALIGSSGCSSDDANSTDDGRYVGGTGSVVLIDQADRPDVPRLEGLTLDGDEVAVEDHVGRVMVMNVWASWCAPCVAEADDLAEVARRYPRVWFLGLNVRDELAAARAFAAEFDVPYPSLSDVNDVGLLLEFPGIITPQAIPSTLVVDVQGRVAAIIHGEVDATTLTGMIEDLRAEGP